MMKKWLIVYEYSPDEYYAEVSLLGEKWKSYHTIINTIIIAKSARLGSCTFAGVNIGRALHAILARQECRLTKRALDWLRRPHPKVTWRNPPTSNANRSTASF